MMLEASIRECKTKLISAYVDKLLTDAETTIINSLRAGERAKKCIIAQLH